MKVLESFLYFIVGISNEGENRNTVITVLITLFDNQKNDVGVCSAAFSFINYLAGEGIVVKSLLSSFTLSKTINRKIVYNMFIYSLSYRIIF